MSRPGAFLALEQALSNKTRARTPSLRLCTAPTAAFDCNKFVDDCKDLLVGARHAWRREVLARNPDCGYAVESIGPLESSDRIDVLGFFWFGCPHCYSLEPALKAWAAKLPADVAFRKVHVPWRDQLQQLYYSLEALNKLALIDKVFEAVHKDKITLQNSQQMAEWLARQGV
ncbi:MAG: hypothetical protein EBX69_06920, partial [Betaproteobacteria bacterium]|nr:hypothetical protein [Betaproteobacteria bacterium]